MGSPELFLFAKKCVHTYIMIMRSDYFESTQCKKWNDSLYSLEGNLHAIPFLSRFNPWSVGICLLPVSCSMGHFSIFTWTLSLVDDVGNKTALDHEKMSLLIIP